MPVQSRWMLRLSLFYFLAGTLVGAAMLLHKAFAYNASVWLFRPIHIQVLIWGFIIQFTLGTGYYILPRYLQGQARGNPILAWGVVVGLNIGIILNVIATYMNENTLGLIGISFQAVAVLLFVLLHWKRIASYNK